MILAAAAMAQSVSVTSPTNGSTVGSPVHFVASANGGSYPVSATWVYVDTNVVSKATGGSLNSYVSLGGGWHSVVVKAWNSVGQLATKSLSVNVSGSTSSAYQNNFNATSYWVSKFVKSDGAILYTLPQLNPGIINPYYSNIAAIGMTKDPNRMPQVVSWMKWYISHLNWPDKWGLYGTTYDWNVNNGVETSSGNADSTDSYAATFLTVVWNAWKSNNSAAQSYIKTLSYQLDAIGTVLLKTQQSDGLTWAKPDYQIKYLMDNCEAYRGLRDLAYVYQYAFGDTTRAAKYNNAANKMLNGILGMWMSGKWAVYKDGIGRLAYPNMSTWYADASAQVFPVLMGVVPASDYRAQQSYAAFNAAWPGWTTLSFNSQDGFPWCLIVDGAAAMGDNTRVAKYISTIQSKYVNSGFPWPFYNAEAGWFIRANNYMLGKGL